MRSYTHGRILAALVVMCCLGTGAGQAVSPVTASQPSPGVEFRAMWVDAGSPGLHNLAEINQLLEFASANHFNALLVELHRKGNTFAAQSITPPSSAKFDGLATLIPLAHARGIEVHAWINVLPVWYGADWPENAHPVFNQHGFYTFEEGPTRSGKRNPRAGFAIDRGNWLTMNNHGETRFPGGTFLDPGHPAAAQFVVSVCKDLLRYYPVDGLHLDFIRYPGVEEDIARGSSAGYNPVSLARFWKARQKVTPHAGPLANSENGQKSVQEQAMEDSLALAAALAMPSMGTLPPAGAKAADIRLPLPAASNQEWVDWRITQVTQLERRIYLESKAINPSVKISAAVITWGHPPTSEADFLNSSAMEWVFQDWRSWLEQGTLDMVLPMNYLPEHRDIMRKWFDGWISWEKQHKYGRQLVVGLGANVNTPAELAAQINRVRQPELGNHADGVAFFSYDNLLHPVAPAAIASAPKAVVTNAVLQEKARLPSANDSQITLDYLARGVNAQTAPFAQPASLPKPAAAEATEGWLIGVALDAEGRPRDGDVAVLEAGGASPRSYRSATDGNGYFGFTGVVPGAYRLRLEAPAGGEPMSVVIVAGKVSRVEIGK